MNDEVYQALKALQYAIEREQTGWEEKNKSVYTALEAINNALEDVLEAAEHEQA